MTPSTALDHVLPGDRVPVGRAHGSEHRGLIRKIGRRVAADVRLGEHRVVDDDGQVGQELEALPADEPGGAGGDLPDRL